MDSEIFMLDEENGYSLILNKDAENSWFVELLDINQKVIFHYKCDTFVTGNLILHLQIGIRSFIKSRNKIVMSRWYPKSDARFLISIVGHTHISPSIYKDKETNKCYVKFIVVEESIEKLITFKVPLQQIQDKIL